MIRAVSLPKFKSVWLQKELMKDFSLRHPLQRKKFGATVKMELQSRE